MSLIDKIINEIETPPEPHSARVRDSSLNTGYLFGLEKVREMASDEQKETIALHIDKDGTPPTMHNDDLIVCLKEDNKFLQRQNKEQRDEIHRLHTLVEQQGKELNRRDELIRKLDKNCDYWEREAKKWCSQLSELRYKIKQQICDKCQDEDTDKCKECNK